MMKTMMITTRDDDDDDKRPSRLSFFLGKIFVVRVREWSPPDS